MQIRRARVDDAAAVAEVHTRSWRSAYEHVFGAERLARIDMDRRRDGWCRAIREGPWDVTVAELDGRVVGFAGTERGGELGTIYVLPERVGTGVGHALMAAAVDLLRSQGCVEAFLWVLADNPRARAFYEREGWQLDGAEKTAELLGVTVRELRYRRPL
jgi:GNAT superfamily N-acetyltransferase